jgi:hypothetical protein
VLTESKEEKEFPTARLTESACRPTKFLNEILQPNSQTRTTGVELSPTFDA